MFYCFKLSKVSNIQENELLLFTKNSTGGFIHRREKIIMSADKQ